MRKIISLTLVFVMLFSATVIMASAALPEKVPDLWDFAISGQRTLNLYYTEKAPKMDGVISEGEYPGPNNGLVDDATMENGLWATKDQTSVYDLRKPEIEPLYAKTYATYDDTFLYFAIEVKEKKHSSQEYHLDVRVGMSQSDVFYETFSNFWTKYLINPNNLVGTVQFPTNNKRCYNIDKEDWNKTNTVYGTPFIDSEGTVWNLGQYLNYFGGSVSEADDDDFVITVYEFAIHLGDLFETKPSNEQTYTFLIEDGKSFKGHFYYYFRIEDPASKGGYYLAQNSVPREEPYDPANKDVSIKDAFEEWKTKVTMYIPNVLTFNGLYEQPGVRSTTAHLVAGTPKETEPPATKAPVDDTKPATGSTQAPSTTSAPSTTKAPAASEDDDGLPVGIIVAISVAAIAIIGGLVYFILKKKSVIK